MAEEKFSKDSGDVEEKVKIESKRKHKGTRKIKINSKMLMVAFTIIVMFGSILTVWIFNPTPHEEIKGLSNLDSFEVSGFTFYKVEDGTFGAFLPTSTGQPWPIKFRLDPREAEGITINPAAPAKIYSSNKIYLTYNPNEEEISKVAVAAIEVSRVIPLVTGLPIIEAYTEDSDPISYDIPLKTCDDATETTAVIQLEIADVNEVEREGDCVIVRGTDADNLILSADKFGMHLVGLKV